MPEIDPTNPVDVYVNSIRSVLLIDDQFPTFGDHDISRYTEVDRARALWKGCTERGWLCDIENQVGINLDDDAVAPLVKRIASCDLLVLDYHIVGQDPTWSQSIVRLLARSPAPNLVVVYTADPNPREVLLGLAIAAKGGRHEPQADVDSDADEIEVEWSSDDVVSLLLGTNVWRRTWGTAWREAAMLDNSMDRKPNEALGKLRLETFMTRYCSLPTEDSVQDIDRICDFSRAEAWFQCGNLFVVIAGKPTDANSYEEEMRALLDSLESAVRAWDPSWLACSVGEARRKVAEGAFRDDRRLPSSALQNGLLEFVRGSARENDEAAKTYRATEVARRLLESRFDKGSELLSHAIRDRATLATRRDADTGNPAAPQDQIKSTVEVNAFLASSTDIRHHLRLGTIFRNGDDYWVCASPACDMTPRLPSQDDNPWAHSLAPLRPFQAVRLNLLPERAWKSAAEEATRGRYLFFHFKDTSGNIQSAAARCFSPEKGDPLPRMETLFAANNALVSDRKATMYRCSKDTNDVPQFNALECDVVAQLRPSYAERLGQVVGGHMSRVGIDYVSYAHQETEQAAPARR